jgi:hypothetical protein
LVVLLPALVALLLVLAALLPVLVVLLLALVVLLLLLAVLPVLAERRVHRVAPVQLLPRSRQSSSAAWARTTPSLKATFAPAPRSR